MPLCRYLTWPLRESCSLRGQSSTVSPSSGSYPISVEQHPPLLDPDRIWAGTRADKLTADSAVNNTWRQHFTHFRQLNDLWNRSFLVMPGAHWGNHKRKRSRTCPNRTRSCPKRIGSVHREKPPPFCERSANVSWNETKRKKLSSVQLCCHIHGTLLPYVAILPVIGRYRLKMAVSSIVSNAQLSKSYIAAIWNLLVTIF